MNETNYADPYHLRNVTNQRDKAQAHAAQLAEALRDVLPYAEGYKSSEGAIERASEALAAYESEVRP